MDPFRHGLELFDAGDYHAAHDALEEVWAGEVGDVRTLLQALIQMAVALYHRQRSNRRGAGKLFRHAAARFAVLPERLCGLDVRDLQRRCAAMAEEEDAGGDYDPALVPRLGPQ